MAFVLFCVCVIATGWYGLRRGLRLTHLILWLAFLALIYALAAANQPGAQIEKRTALHQ